jgi:hypothetical protein
VREFQYCRQRRTDKQTSQEFWYRYQHWDTHIPGTVQIPALGYAYTRYRYKQTSQEFWHRYQHWDTHIPGTVQIPALGYTIHIYQVQILAD